MKKTKNKIKILFMDVDGTLTDGKIYMGEHGELMKAFSIKDGYAIRHYLKEAMILPVIITGRQSKIVEKRCRELEITEIYQNAAHKVELMDKILEEHGFSRTEAAYIGDDINDLDCMNYVSVTGCPADAVKEIRDIADYISENNGGNGAVRDFIEWLIVQEKYA